MSLVSTVLAFAIPLATLAWMAMRDHRTQQARRRGLLDDCISLFDRYALTHGGDGFPRLAGRTGGRNVDVRLVCDTMTMRRLPQLWLQVTALEPLAGVSGFAVLVRPSGYEFYSLTVGFHHVIEPPSYLPRELIVRGRDAAAAALFARLAPALAPILADPRVKEIAVTREGLRLIRQADEGRRGEYLLLRQAVFDDAAVSAARLEEVLAALDGLKRAIRAPAVREVAIA